MAITAYSSKTAKITSKHAEYDDKRLLLYVLKDIHLYVLKDINLYVLKDIHLLHGT